MGIFAVGVSKEENDNCFSFLIVYVSKIISVIFQNRQRNPLLVWSDTIVKLHKDV